MPSSNDIELYKQSHQMTVAAGAKASHLIDAAPQALQQTLQGWKSDPVCPSGNYGVPLDVIAIAASKGRFFVPSTPEEKQTAEALAHYYTAAIDTQKKWALFPPHQKRGLTPPDPLTFT